MSIGTKIYTWMYGKLVGTDDVGNKYIPIVKTTKI